MMKALLITIALSLSLLADYPPKGYDKCVWLGTVGPTFFQLKDRAGEKAELMRCLGVSKCTGTDKDPLYSVISCGLKEGSTACSDHKSPEVCHQNGEKLGDKIYSDEENAEFLNKVLKKGEQADYSFRGHLLRKRSKEAPKAGKESGRK